VSALKSAVSSGTIFVKFDIGNFYEKMPKNPNFVKTEQKYQATDMTI
jgi:hypothetical protein